MIILFNLYLWETGNESTSAKHAFVQNFEIEPPLDTVDGTLNQLSLQWAADHKIDHTIDEVSMSTVKIKIGEW